MKISLLMEPVQNLMNELRMGGEDELMGRHAAILADELQIRCEVVVPAGSVDVALTQEGLR